MTKEQLIRKISSRKFWVLIASFIGSMLIAFNFGENQIAQVTAIISSFGSVAVYILAEASVDKASLQAESIETRRVK